MATLSGNKIKDTYQSLIKLTDNGNLTTGAKRVTDGFGNNSPLFLSTTQIGIGVTPTVQFHASGDGKFGGNLTVIGNLVVEGSTTTVGTDTLTVKDPLIVLANNNTSNDAVDIGFYGKYRPSSTTLFAGLFRDAGDDKFKLFKSLQVEPTTTVNTSGTGYTVATLVSNLEGNVTGNVTGNVSGSSGSTTGNAATATKIASITNSNIVQLTSSQTLTNKTIDLDNNTVSNIEVDNLKSGVLDTDLSSVSGSDDTLASAKAIKTYVDAQVDTADTLSEILAIGNTTGATKIEVDNTSGGVDFIDNAKARFGTGDDLEIYHDGSDSYISDTGAGLLFVRSSGTRIQATNGNNGITFNEGGSVDLYHNNNLKFATTSTGAKVTGSNLNVFAASGATKLEFGQTNGNWKIEAGNSGNNTLIIGSVSNATNNITLDTTNGGSATFAGNVLIGTSATTDGKLNIVADGETTNFVKLKSTKGTGNIYGLKTNGGNSEVLAIMDITAGNRIAALGNNEVAFNIAGVQKLSIDSSGNSTFAGNVAVNGNATLGDGTSDDHTINGQVTHLTADALGYKLHRTGGGTSMLISASGDAELEFGTDNGSGTNTTHWTIGKDGTDNSFRIANSASLGTSDALTIDSSENSTFAGNVSLADSKKIQLGASQDLQIYHDGSNSIIADTGTGNLLLRGNTQIRLQGIDESNMVIGNQGGGVNLYHNNSQKFETTSTGVSVTGALFTTTNVTVGVNATFVDNGKAIFGAGSDLQIFHDGNNSFIIDQGTGDLNITSDGVGVNLQKGNSEYLARFLTDGAVELYHDSVKKFETTSTGVKINSTGAGAIATVEAGDANQASLDLKNTEGHYRVITDAGEYKIFDQTDSRTPFLIDTSGNSTFAGGITVAGNDAQFNHNIILEGNIFHKDDTDTFFGFVTDNEYKVTVGNSTKIFADANSAYLYHQGNLKLQTTSTGINITGGADTQAVITGTTTAARLDIKTNSHHRFLQTIESDGKFRLFNQTTNSEQFSIASNNDATFAGAVEVNGNLVVDGAGVSTDFQLRRSANAAALLTINAPGGSPNGSVFSINGNSVMTLDANQDATFAGIGEFAGAIRITETGTAQNILIGNQDSGGTNKPGMIRSANASLEFGYGDSWTGEGGNMTSIMKVDSSGRVAIGTTSPNKKLEILSTASDHLRLAFSGSAYWDLFQNAADGSFRILKDNGSLFTFSQSGNLGIGTTSPFDSKLQVVGRIRAAGGTSGGYFFGSDEFDGGFFAPADGNLAFSTNNVERVRIDGNGNVGIGTTSPTFNVGSGLEISRAGVATLRVTDSDGTTGSTELLQADADGYLFTRQSGALVFGTNDTERARITSGGKVGIGTTSPTADLSVGSTATSTGDVHLRTTKTTFSITPSNSDAGGILLDLGFVNGGQGPMKFGIGGTEKMRLDASGRLGIGNTSPQALLHSGPTQTIHSNFTSGLANSRLFVVGGDNGGASVFQSGNSAGAISIFGNTTSGGAIGFYHSNISTSQSAVGSITTSSSATAFNTSSDYRLKEDLQDFAGLDMVSKISVYDFKWKVDESRSYGVMAHELEEVLPQAVNGEKDAEEMQSVDYSKLVPILLKSIQELQERIKQLEDK